jgi:hypothetical protein
MESACSSVTSSSVDLLLSLQSAASDAMVVSAPASAAAVASGGSTAPPANRKRSLDDAGATEADEAVAAKRTDRALDRSERAERAERNSERAAERNSERAAERAARAERAESVELTPLHEPGMLLVSSQPAGSKSWAAMCGPFDAMALCDPPTRDGTLTSTLEIGGRCMQYRCITNADGEPRLLLECVECSHEAALWGEVRARNATLRQLREAISRSQTEFEALVKNPGMSLRVLLWLRLCLQRAR